MWFTKAVLLYSRCAMYRYWGSCKLLGWVQLLVVMVLLLSASLEKTNDLPYACCSSRTSAMNFSTSPPPGGDYVVVKDASLI